VSKNAFSAVLSTEGRVAGLCWEHLKPQGPQVVFELKRFVTLDVIVPSFRAPKEILRRIASLEVPPRCSTQVSFLH